MKYRTRIHYTEEHKAVMWDRWQKGDTLHDIARLFDRHHSSVQGNGGSQNYRATPADKAAWDRARRPKACKLLKNRAMARLVTEKLRQFWSPEQIAGWLKRTYPDDENNQVSHETIVVYR